MKTKTFRKTTGLTIMAVLIVLIVFLLLKNRGDMQKKLTAMKNFNEIVPVETATAQLIDFTPELTESGMFVSNSDVQTVSETEGQIVQLKIQVGDKVNAGQALAAVEDKVAKSRFELAKENFKKAEKDLNRFTKLAGGKAATKQQLEASKLSMQEAETRLTEAKKELENKIIKAPISGTISECLVEKGTWLSSGKQICTISDQSRMIFQVKLSDDTLWGLSVRQTVDLEADALPGQSFTGKVKNIGVTADQSGRYLCEVEVPNNGDSLRSGMIGQATFHLRVEKNRLVIPRSCIEGSLQRAHVFVLKDNKVTRRTVAVELLNSDFVSVISGLQPGEKVITTGQVNLSEGTSVKVLNN